MNKLKEIFGTERILGLAGIKNSGKTNNLVSLIVDYRKYHVDTPIYAFGMPTGVMKFLKTQGVKEISSLKHLVKKKNCLLILDEYQRLKLNDRRYKDDLDEFVDFVYHNNVYVILCSPNLREFNSIIGGVIEKWLLKSVKPDMCVNGSQLKKVIESYKGRYKSLGTIEMPVDKLLVINEEQEMVVTCGYIEQADNKKSNEDIFKIVRKKSQDCQEIVKTKKLRVAR